MSTGDTANPTSEAGIAELATAFAALRTPAETEPAAPVVVEETPVEPVAEVEDVVPEKVRIRIGDEEVDEDTLLEWKKSGLRQADYTKKTQEVSAKATKLEQERAAERAETLQRWQALEDAVASQTPKEPDWVSLEAQVRAGTIAEADYNRFVADWHKADHQRKAIVAEKQKAEEAVQADRQKQSEAQAQQNYERVLELIPEWKEPTVRQKDFVEMRGYVQAIAPDLPESVLLSAHPALFKALRDASAYHKLQQSASKPQVVKVDSITLKPGSAPTTTPKVNAVESAARKLKASGKEEDLASFFKQARKVGAV